MLGYSGGWQWQMIWACTYTQQSTASVKFYILVAIEVLKVVDIFRLRPPPPRATYP